MDVSNVYVLMDKQGAHYQIVQSNLVLWEQTLYVPKASAVQSAYFVLVYALFLETRTTKHLMDVFLTFKEAVNTYYPKNATRKGTIQ